MREKAILGAALLATVLVYWAGLHGPFLLDDGWNLEPVAQWARGSATWQFVVFDNRSGPLGRPLSMASFLLTAALGGHVPFAYKLGNLVVHLLCGWLAWQVLRHALRLDRHLAGHADLVASLLAAIWLLHPLNASTVLYPVQRMAQLSTLFVLAAAWAYLAARAQLALGRTRRALAGLFVTVPLLVLAGLLSKENAAVAPLLFLVLEGAYYAGRPMAATAVPRRTVRGIVLAFYALFLAVPLAIGAATFLRPARLLAAYGPRDFTPIERLLTEGRVLVDYLGLLLFPRGPRMGVYNDDYLLSTGLFSPPATFWCLLALAAVTAVAVALRKRAPSLFAGWLFFLAAHSLESTIYPLELYFEHRNYLPAVGLWLAVAGTVEFATRRARARMDSPVRLGTGVAAAFVVVLALATFGRSLVWQDEGRIYAQALQAHPHSGRVMTSNFEYALQTNDARRAHDALRRMLASDDRETRLMGVLSRIRYGCISREGAAPDDLRLATQLAPVKPTILVHLQLETLADLGPPADCGPVTPLMLARMAATLADKATGLPDRASRKLRIRAVASRWYGRAGHWQEAQQQAERAWQPGAEPAIGGFLVRTYAHNGRMADAERTFREVQARTSPYNLDDAAGLQALRGFLDARRGQPASTPAPAHATGAG